MVADWFVNTSSPALMRLSSSSEPSFFDFYSHLTRLRSFSELRFFNFYSHLTNVSSSSELRFLDFYSHSTRLSSFIWTTVHWLLRSPCDYSCCTRFHTMYLWLAVSRHMYIRKKRSTELRRSLTYILSKRFQFCFTYECNPRGVETGCWPRHRHAPYFARHYVRVDFTKIFQRYRYARIAGTLIGSW